eukprot:ctg_1456.g516
MRAADARHRLLVIPTDVSTTGTHTPDPSLHALHYPLCLRLCGGRAQDAVQDVIIRDRRRRRAIRGRGAGHRRHPARRRSGGHTLYRVPVEWEGVRQHPLQGPQTGGVCLRQAADAARHRGRHPHHEGGRQATHHRAERDGFRQAWRVRGGAGLPDPPGRDADVRCGVAAGGSVADLGRAHAHGMHPAGECGARRKINYQGRREVLDVGSRRPLFPVDATLPHPAGCARRTQTLAWTSSGKSGQNRAHETPPNR